MKPRPIALLLASVVASLAVAAERKPLGEEPAAAAYTTISDAGKPFQLADGFQLIRPQGADGDGKLPNSLGSGQPLLLQDGRLFCAIVDGGVVKSTFSTDRGRTWTAPALLDKHPDDKVKPGRPASLQARDGTIWVFYFGFVKYDAKNPAECESDVWGIRSIDGGKTWTGRARVFDGYVGMLQGAIQTESGNLLVPLCHFFEPTRFIGGCAASTDDGKTWSFAGPVDIGPDADAKQRNPYNGGALEPTIVELRDDRILMLLRTITGRMWRCESSDGGLTWTKPVPSEFSCGGTIYITRLLSGRLALVWNPANWDAPEAKKKGYPHGYGNAAVALSDDDGATWSTPIYFAKSDRTVHSLVTSTGKDGPLLITLPGRAALLHVDERRLLRPSTTLPAATEPAAIDVGDKEQLFVDQSLVAASEGVSSHLPAESVDRLLRSAPILKRTPRTVTGPRWLQTILIQPKRDGYVIERDQTDLDVTCLGAPVFRGGTVVAAISIGAPSARAEGSGTGWIRTLRSAAQAISRKLDKGKRATA